MLHLKPSRFRYLLGAAVALFVLIGQPAATEAPKIGQVSQDSVWVPTPERVIRRMLQMADTTSRDVVVDLGAGDGRIPSVIALYISPGVMTRLKPRLLELRPGTRVVSHNFTLEDWEPDETIRVENRSAHLWVVPASVHGAWSLELPGEAFVMRIEQRYQALSTAGERSGKPVAVIGAQLRGTEIRFSAFDRDGSSRQFSGTVQGARMSGRSEGEGIAPLPWTATLR
jgi:hypothetical protein